MSSLRSRLILSHVLPLLVVVPLVGISLAYVIETQVLLQNLTHDLTLQAAQVASAAANRDEIWQDPAQAQVFLEGLNTPGSIMLLSPSGRLIASRDPAGVYLPGQVIALGGGAPGQGAQVAAPILRANGTDVLLPVQGADQHIVGIVRISRELAGIYERFERFRSLMLGMLGIELLLGVLIGLYLALKLEKTLAQVTQAILAVATDQELTLLPERGPDEIRTVLRAFNTMTARLQEAQDSRKRLLANLVHELGRPLGALRSAVHALQHGADQDPALRQELLAGIEAQLQRLEPLLDNLAQLHDSLLDLPRLKRRPVALFPWLCDVVTPWRAAAEEKHLHWEMTLPDDSLTLDIDPDRLAQAIGNLLSNAVKFTEPQGTIAVSVVREDGQVRIGVQDSGPGIAPDEQPRVFEPFYRGGKRFPQGLGLGLAIARDLVTAHAGRIELESQPGVGSQFTICLPCG